MAKISADMALPMFCRLSGMDIDKGQDYSCLCHNAYSEIKPLFKKSELNDSECERVLFLIAAIAWERCVMSEISRECTTAVKLLDASFSENPLLRLECATKLKKSAMSACSDILFYPGSVILSV